MCGITLLVNKNGKLASKDYLITCNEALHHRGPDESSVYIDKNIGLAHTRLSIVGLAGGAQPFFDSSENIIAICNGEIYNYQSLKEDIEQKGYQLRGTSDNEIIVPLYKEYGVDFVKKLNGMFSLFIYDKIKKKVIGARDRFGIKPLFFHDNESCLIFSSEIKPILLHPSVKSSLNKQSIYDLFTFGYNMDESTSFEGIVNFPHATLFEYTVTDKKLLTDKYWRPIFNASYNKKKRAAHKTLLTLFRSSVDSHLMSEVPLSSYMSGGIDSTSITVTANSIHKARSKFKVFSLLFPSSPEFDEYDFISNVTSQNNLQVDYINSNSFQYDELDKAIYHLEQPQFFTLDIAYLRLSKTLRDQNRKVALTGDGADELLGGYNHFVISEYINKIPTYLPKRLQRFLCKKLLQHFGLPDDFIDFYYLEVFEKKEDICKQFGFIPPWYGLWKYCDSLKKPLFKDNYRQSLGEDSLVRKITSEITKSYPDLPKFQRSILLELNSRLPNWVLWKSDRNSMANSVEVRVPFLENRLADYLLSLPVSDKVRFLNEKHILKKAFKGILPSRITSRRKFAFNTPRDWLYSNRSPEVLNLLSQENIAKSDIFDYRGVSDLLKGLRTDPNKNSMRYVISTFLLNAVITTQMLFFKFKNEKSLNCKRSNKQQFEIMRSSEVENFNNSAKKQI